MKTPNKPTLVQVVETPESPQLTVDNLTAFAHHAALNDLGPAKTSRLSTLGSLKSTSTTKAFVIRRDQDASEATAVRVIPLVPREAPSLDQPDADPTKGTV